MLLLTERHGSGSVILRLTHEAELLNVIYFPNSFAERVADEGITLVERLILRFFARVFVKTVLHNTYTSFLGD
jgi:hypothetical protein